MFTRIWDEVRWWFGVCRESRRDRVRAYLFHTWRYHDSVCRMCDCCGVREDWYPDAGWVRYGTPASEGRDVARTVLSGIGETEEKL